MAAHQALFSDIVSQLQVELEEFYKSAANIQTLVAYLAERGYQLSGANPNVVDADFQGENDHITTDVLNKIANQFTTGIAAFLGNQAVTQRDYRGMIFDMLRQAPIGK